MKHSIVAVVLDAGTEAGLATAHSLLADGHRVVVTARQAGPLVRITHGYPPTVSTRSRPTLTIAASSTRCWP
ncbi:MULTISPECIES: hypothetical protein [Mycobacteriaceae]|uniref:Uncharacterized protein n=1 Tax=Mycolicibacterium mucogenicum TaxID=56689 RepID=A0A4R5WK65_MYCMU|nr:hypothetical protein [Mycolicibacterium mucogenicum]TDK91271.1 hypothetical protein EUA03_08300 [Mycolicibacterium mucogenicum]